MIRSAISTAMTQPLIDMVGIRKVYRHGLLETDALTSVTVTVNRGEFVSLMGPSGSGKTTFLNLVGLLDSFDAGTYRLDGRDVGALSDSESSGIRARCIGFVFQTFNLLGDLSVWDNVDVPLRYQGLDRGERRDRVDAALAKVGLTARRKHLPSQLSGGQQQRVAIARAIATSPLLLLADEPTGNLDSVTAHQIIELLESLVAGGTTIVMVTHAAELAARAQRRWHVLDGKIIDPRRRDAAADRHEAVPT